MGSGVWDHAGYGRYFRLQQPRQILLPSCKFLRAFIVFWNRQSKHRRIWPQLELELQMAESVYRQNKLIDTACKAVWQLLLPCRQAAHLAALNFSSDKGWAMPGLTAHSASALITIGTTKTGCASHLPAEWASPTRWDKAPTQRPSHLRPEAAWKATWTYIQSRQAWERNLFSAYGAWLSLRFAKSKPPRSGLLWKRNGLKAIQVREEDGGTAAMAVHEATQQLLAAQDQYEEAQFAAESALRALQRLIGSEVDSSVLGAFAPGVGESSRRVGV